jgi:hypothetical protein
MQNASYTMRRDYANRWLAESWFNLGEKRRLTISTKKTGGGYVQAFASVATMDGAWASHVIFQDYARTVISEKRVATEKAIKDVHEKALAMAPEIIAEVAAFYERAAA